MMQKLMLADIIDNSFTLIVSDNFKTQKLKILMLFLNKILKLKNSKKKLVLNFNDSCQ